MKRPFTDEEKKRLSESIKNGYKNGRVAWAKGRKFTRMHRKKLSEARLTNDISGNKHPRWKGEKVSYRNLHRWVEREMGKPDTCSQCNLSGLRERQIHWANKSRYYKRELSDWLRLCAKCHKAYDSKKMANI